MNGDKTISDTLRIGIEFNGEIHRKFTLRLPTVGDEIDLAESDVPDAGYRVGLMATCLESLGSIPKDDITYDLLRTMESDDFRQLIDARDALKKKLRAPSEDSGTSDTPASGSDDTDTAKAK